MRNLFFLAFGVFAVGCNSLIVNALLFEISQTIDQRVELTSQGITLFNLAYFFSALLLSLFPISRMVSSTIKFALMVLFLGNVLTLISENIFVFLLGRTFTGIGSGIFSPMCVSFVVRIIDSSAKGRILSLILGINSAGVVFGVPMGHYLSTIFNWQASIFYIISFNLLSLIGFHLQKLNIYLQNPLSFAQQIRLISDKKILYVIGITFTTCAASLGLYSYISVIQIGYSLTTVLFVWGLGGFFGSSLVGIFIDYTKNPNYIMTIILTGLMSTFFALGFLKHLTYYAGLMVFFLWGMFSWATTVAQQCILFEIRNNQNAPLSALNASAIGLGAAFGTAAGGLIIASGFKEETLPFFALTLLLFAVMSHLVVSKIQIKSLEYA